MNHDITKCIEDLAARCHELGERESAEALRVIAITRKTSLTQSFACACGEYMLAATAHALRSESRAVEFIEAIKSVWNDKTFPESKL